MHKTLRLRGAAAGNELAPILDHPDKITLAPKGSVRLGAAMREIDPQVRRDAPERGPAGLAIEALEPFARRTGTDPCGLGRSGGFRRPDPPDQQRAPRKPCSGLLMAVHPVGLLRSVTR